MVLVVHSRPDRTPGLTNYPDCDTELKGIVAELWGDLDGVASTSRKFGKGRVFFAADLTPVLHEINLPPDFAFQSGADAPIHWIHRRAGDADIYFIANRRRRSENLLCRFRVNGKQPEFWDAATGEIAKAPIYEAGNGTVSVPLRLDPAGSVFVVFRSPAAQRPVRDVVHDKTGTVLRAEPPIGGIPRVLTADNFTISVWVKPDMDMVVPRIEGGGMRGGADSGRINPTFVVYPPVSESPSSSSTCGLAVGRNGVAIYERTSGNPAPVFAAALPIAGWTHVAVIYRYGVPSLYLDGESVGHGSKSRQIVRPILWDSKDAPMDFMGQSTIPELIPEAIDDARLQQIVAAGLPAPEEPVACEPAPGPRPAMRFWQDGQYLLRDSSGRETPIWVTGAGKPVEIATPWTVKFPPNLGAPPEITLAQLKSLHRHDQDGVKYFSGTAKYGNRFQAPADFKSPGRRLYLDLGRVEVIAEVKVNGKLVANLWKFPFRADITDAVRVGDNELEIEVTNLWPNRLIGDEQNPAEHEYASPTGAISAIPEWYASGKPKPAGPRIAFSTWKWYSKDDPLLESGLLGPVCLRTAIIKEV
jgi:hypothetical protein